MSGLVAGSWLTVAVVFASGAAVAEIPFIIGRIAVRGVSGRMPTSFISAVTALAVVMAGPPSPRQPRPRPAFMSSHGKTPPTSPSKPGTAQ